MYKFVNISLVILFGSFNLRKLSFFCGYNRHFNYSTFYKFVKNDSLMGLEFILVNDIW